MPKRNARCNVFAVGDTHVALDPSSSRSLRITPELAEALGAWQGGSLLPVWRAVKRTRGPEAAAQAVAAIRGLLRQGMFRRGRVRFAPPDPTTALPTLELNTVRACSLRCRCCYAHPQETDYDKPPMSKEVAKRAIDLLLEQHGASSPMVRPYSAPLGEPFLPPELSRFAQEHAMERAVARDLGRRRAAHQR